MARFLFIVARQLPLVYDHLRQQFGAEPNVQVIVDRRKETRPPAPAESAPGERRQRAVVDEQLRTMGYAFVRLDD